MSVNGPDVILMDDPDSELPLFHKTEVGNGSLCDALRVPCGKSTCGQYRPFIRPRKQRRPGVPGVFVSSSCGTVPAKQDDLAAFPVVPIRANCASANAAQRNEAHDEARAREDVEVAWWPNARAIR
jgi:hypothetical protein